MERFWKTLVDEFLSRTVSADFADCERRMALSSFTPSNFRRRPHQALSGLVPADRYPARRRRCETQSRRASRQQGRCGSRSSSPRASLI
ncbi:MAG: hypothetical protein IPJ65_34550 [Archangiaceae bacterium]|nr:hypothetical protein [Archangiaceae bacterium]